MGFYVEKMLPDENDLPSADIFYTDKDLLFENWQVLETPGHTLGSSCLYNENEKSLYKFYSFNGLEFLLDFTVDENGNLFCMNIIFDRLSEKHSQEMIFIKN